MKESDLKKLSKSELIDLLMKQKSKKPEIVIVDDTKPVKQKPVTKQNKYIPKLRKSVKKIASDYEEKNKKINNYPMIETTSNKFRRDELKLSKDKTKHTKTFYNLFETRLNNIPGDRGIVSINIDVVIRDDSFNYTESDIKLNKSIKDYKNEPKNNIDNIDEYLIPYKKVIKQRLFYAKDDGSVEF